MRERDGTALGGGSAALRRYSCGQFILPRRHFHWPVLMFALTLIINCIFLTDLQCIGSGLDTGGAGPLRAGGLV